MTTEQHSQATEDAGPATLPERYHPIPDVESEHYWQGCREDKLLVQRCKTCGPYFFPRSFCPSCWSDDIEIVEASGRGTVYTYSIVHQNPAKYFRDLVPYVVAMIELEEGPRMMANVVDCSIDAVTTGMPVEVQFVRHSDDVTIPQFAPAPG